MKKGAIYISIMMISSAMLGQAWTKEKGKFYSKLGVNAIQSEVVYDYTGNIVDSVLVPGTDSLVKVPKLFESMLQFYGMYGVTDKLTVVGSIPFKFIKNFDKNTTRATIADIELGGVYGAKTEGLRVTPGLFIGIPTGFYDTITTTYTGDGEWNFMPRVYIGNGTSKFYYTGFIGFNYRTGGRFHEIDGLLEGGYSLGKVYLIFKMQFKESLNGGKDIYNITGIYDNGQEFISPNLGLYYKHTEKLHFSLNIGGAIQSRNAQGAASVNIGVAYEN